MRKAKIVATLGPSSSTQEEIKNLILAGLNVARVNMSHGTHERHAHVIGNIRKASVEIGREVAVLLDLQGPKIRVDKLTTPIELQPKMHYLLGFANSKLSGEPNFIPSVYENLVNDLQSGQRVLFDDGLIEAVSTKKVNDCWEIEVINGGTLKSNKGINLPDSKVSAPSLTEKDRDDLIFGLKQEVNYVALSFVRTASDVIEVKKILHKLKLSTPVVAKIERPEAVANIDEIINVCDAIMVARGDMGVEVGNHLVPSIQKLIIKKCNSAGVPVITATQMLESMVENPSPTRAEASDVANAIWDGTDAVMLSAETASGRHPVRAIQMMSKIVEEAEKTPKERPLIRHIDLSGITASLQVSASLIAEKTFAKYIVCITESGRSSRLMSRFRPGAEVVAVANSLDVVRRMSLYWGITPYYYQGSLDNATEVEESMLGVLGDQLVNGDKVVFARGDGAVFQRSRSNSVRVEVIKNRPRIHGENEAVEKVEFAQGAIHLDTSLCSSCHRCIHVCPFGIWEIDKSNHLRNTKINSSMASHCTMDMACVDACPTGAIEIIPKG